MLSLIICALNLAYGNCSDDGSNFSYAPDVINHRHMSLLTSNDYERANWWPVTDKKPEVESNMLAHAYGWKKRSYEVSREVIDWVPTDPPQTNEWGEVIYIPVTNTVYDTKYWIERLYNQVLKPIEKPTPRRYSGWKMYKSISEHGYGDKFNALLQSDVKIMVAFVRPQYFMEDDADFKAMLTSMCTALGISDSERDAILSESVDFD